jgi:2-keto-4-pentenoate hydratase/2-oxohepta-3-ene-1,7-dioic acid hydratase in catechol pathway
LDFELEIAVYIGKQGVDILPEEAMEHVAGYSLFNDFSARDVQFEEMRGRLGPSKSKDFDTGNSLGPYLVTADDIDLSTLQMEVRVNGETWARSTAASLEHDVPRTIAFISGQETLYPGDVIGLGTVPNGCGLELNRWIQPGDVVSLCADGLGTLTNQVAAPETWAALGMRIAAR